ncbi:MAG: hypothetical protein V1668_02875 [Patescibacteria group bacterium]
MRTDKPVEEKKPEPFAAPQPMGKIAMLGIMAVAGSALFWYAWSRILQQGLDFHFGAKSAVAVVSTLLAFCLMFVFFALVNVMVRNFWAALMIVAASGFTLFGFFRVNIWTLLGALVVMFGWIYWRRQVRLESKNQLKFSPQRAAAAGLSTTITILLLAVSLCYYSFLVQRTDSEAEFAERIIDGGARAVQNILDMYYRDKFSAHMPLDTFIANVGNLTAEKADIKTGQVELDRVITRGVDQAEAEAVAIARDEFLDTFKIQATGDEEMQSVVRKLVRHNTDRYLGEYMKFIPGLLALSIFFLLKIFTFVYRELIKSLSFLAFTILVWVKFLHMKKVQIEAEKISL